MMLEETIFNDVYQNYHKKRVFNPFIIDQLPFYKMGIFGSITPTSDIDIGIQYSGSNPELIGLSYIVSVFEDLFLIFTGINSLQFDIETYADMMTIPNLDEHTNKEHPDVFYLDTTNFQETHFHSMIPFIESSILRNYVTAELAIGNKNNINDIINSFSYNEFNTNVPKISDIIKKTYLNNTKFGYSNEENTNITLNKEAKKMVADYMNASYDEAREKYYKYVNETEKSLIHVKNIYKQTNEVVLTPEEIVVIMQNIAKSLIYRAESYTCGPTVMHVVRVLQANIKNPTKYDTLKPGYCITNKNKDAYCSIGIYGYLISICEQLGYLYRFYITYCIKDDVPEKCSKKNKKYRERFNNANKNIESIMTRYSNKTNGGKNYIKKRTKNNAKKINTKTIKKRKCKK
jgi:virulence-associated protein VapD